jgi:hypothetical protein
MNEKIVCTLSAAPMRREPSDKAEMVNQIVYGETAHVLDENEKWYMIQLDHDQYEGWIDKKQVKVTEEVKSDTYPVRKIFETREGKIIPCGGYINTNSNNPENRIEAMNTLIDNFLGSPYLWGGRTFMGIDCSGFTQIIFRSIGMDLPRDAYQQAEKGETIAFIEECAPGDLAFFDNADGRITHVGIITDRDVQGRLQIAHASGEVRKDYLDHQGIFNQDKGQYSHNLRLLKRL